MNRNETYDVVVVGAGLSGLTAAKVLNEANISVLLIDAADAIGGRVKTSVVEGFKLDHGFQVLLTAYPDIQKHITLKNLNMASFFSGASIWTGKKFETVADPLKHPLEGLTGAFNTIGTLSDKLKILSLKYAAAGYLKNDAYWHHTETSTVQFLRQYGFSEQMISKFFQPFFSGIFLEPDLQTSSRLFAFLYACFAAGSTALPEGGMQAIPEALAAQLTQTTIMLNTMVTAVEENRVKVRRAETPADTEGDWVSAKAVVIATDANTAESLLPETVDRQPFHNVSCYYFSSATPPPFGKKLVLNTVPGKRITTLCCPSAVQPSYSQNGQFLISVSSLAPHHMPETLQGIESELREWFGRTVDQWKFLRHYSIPRALPIKTMPFNSLSKKPVKTHFNTVYLAGDYLDTPSINGAVSSGEKAAEAVKQALNFS
ncbi:MAG: NAD(P)/FAD-dependent oxidoreductase [Cyanobacteria bacterium P01_H01_bin.74]